MIALSARNELTLSISEQARLDGAICNFTEKDKRDFLRKAHDEHGIRNIEMECSCWIAICNRANVKCK